MYGHDHALELLHAVLAHVHADGAEATLLVEDQTLTLKQNKGPKLVFTLDEGTILEGFYQLSELKPRQKIKVWYRPDGKENVIEGIFENLKAVNLGLIAG